MNNIYQNLKSQLTKPYRHNRQGSFKTKERYYEAMKRFCCFLAEKYRLEKLANIAPKHIFAYADYMKEKNLSASTIKTDLGAIRFYHDMVANPRYPKLPDNSELKLARRSFGKADRSWSEREFSDMVQIAIEGDRQDYVAIFRLARHVGLRIHECFRIDTAISRQAVNTGKIVIKGKGGQVRSVPIFSNTVNILNQLLLSTEPGHKLFVPKDTSAHN
jgi:Site-specific recombinase XerD